MGALGERGLHVIWKWCDFTAVASDGLENGNDHPPCLCVLEALLSVELSLALPHSFKASLYYVTLATKRFGVIFIPQ